MGNIRGITLDVSIGTDKAQQKLRAIAKHAESLADELKRIDDEDEDLPTKLEGSC